MASIDLRGARGIRWDVAMVLTEPVHEDLSSAGGHEIATGEEKLGCFVRHLTDRSR